MVKARADLAPKSTEEKTRDVSLGELELKFDLIEGHKHNGVDSPRIVFNDLINISINTPTNGEILKWDESLSSWVNNTLSEANIASSDSFETHKLSTTSVHGIADTADIALKSGSINQFVDIISSGEVIEDSVIKRHNQNTDVGTSSSTFYLGLDGPKIKGNLGAIEIRNNNDSDYADLIVQNLIVKGTTTIVESETVVFNDNILTLNSNYTGSNPFENGGLEIQRGTLPNASIIWDESTDLWKAGVVEAEKTIVRESNRVTLTGNVTGSAVFDLDGNISISTLVLDNSHNHIISNIAGLQDILDSKSDNTHTHDYVSKIGDVMVGALTAPEYRINSNNTKLVEGLDNTIRLQTSNGYVDIGPQNTSYAHFSTDRSAFHFNKPIEAVNQFKISGSNTYFTSTEGRINNNVVWHTGNDGANSGLDADLLDGQQGSYYLNWSNFTNTPTTISGYGITDAALQSDLTSHTAATTSVHGITNTSDLALKSGSINQFADITSSGINIEDAVTKRHVQNTDVGTSSTTFYLGLNGPRIKGNLGAVEIRNSNDSDYADLVVQNLTVKGTTTTIESETVTFTDNILTLNSSYTGSTPIENGGLEIERGTLTNAAIIWDESNDLWRAGLANTEKTLVRESNIVALTGDVTGSAVFNSVGNVSILTEVQDDSHNHIISNIDELQNILDNKSDTTHTHAINDLTDVVLSTISNGEVLVYDSVTVGWVNKTLDDAGIATATHDHDTTYLGINATAVNSDKLDGQDGVYYLNWSNFTNTPTTVSGYGITDAALESELSNHAASTTSVHGIVDTADIALKSGSVNQFSDITSSGTIIEDAVSKRHNQNTDIGTSSTTFYIGTSGPKIKNNSGIFELKNNADTAYVDLVVNNLVVKGTTTTIESETITFNDNILVLNNNYTGSAPTENAGLEVERGTLVNASLIWDESKDLWRTGLAGAEKTIVSEGNTVTVTGDTTGSAAFDSNGNISVSIQVVDDSHNHIISNIDGLQAALDSKSSTTHNHDSVYLKLVGGTLTGDLSINKTLAVINAGTSSNNVLSLQSMGSIEVVIDSNNDNTDKLFSIKSNSQANNPITKVDETGNFTTAGYVAVYNGSAKIIYNASTESLDFVFV